MARGVGTLTFLAAMAVGLGGGQLALMLTSQELRHAEPLSIEQELAALEAPQDTPEPQSWPAVFDVYVPDPPKVQAPPKPRTRYDLVGLVAGGESNWAIIRSPGGERLVRKGDRLSGGETVLRIAADGVWIKRGASEEKIGFSDSIEQTFASLLSNGPLEPQQAEITMDAFTGRDMRRVLGRAGSVRMVQPEGGAGDKFPEILSVREGQLYDLIGLRRGDMVLRVNGHSVSDPETLANAPDILSSSDEFAVEILRGGRPQTITVKIGSRG